MERDGDDKEVKTSAGRSSPRDGLINFEHFSLEQLLELESGLDPKEKVVIFGGAEPV